VEGKTFVDDTEFIDQSVDCGVDDCVYFGGGGSDYIAQELGKVMNTNPNSWMDFISFS
jgi:hypothetical protein